MAHNFFVSYDLMAPGQHYDRVIRAIKETGDWAKIEFSFFYVSSSMSLVDLTNHVWNSMDANDKLIVIDATENNAYSYNVDQVVVDQMRKLWHR